MTREQNPTLDPVVLKIEEIEMFSYYLFTIFGTGLGECSATIEKYTF